MSSRIIDKNFCMSSFLAFRYVERDNCDFSEKLQYKLHKTNQKEIILVDSSLDIDIEIKRQLSDLKNRYKKIGILLSGGMDSAIIASYLSGCDAYTFRFLGGSFQKEELKRAEYYANFYGLKLHYVDIDWSTVTDNLNSLMMSKGGPVHSIETQICQAAKKAKADGVQIMVIGESSDLNFGGMDGLLSKNWLLNEFMDRYVFVKPEKVLKDFVSVKYLFERYRINSNKIDFIKFIDEIFSVDSSNSYVNAFLVSNLPFYDPYAKLKMKSKLDLERIRKGESKYLIRELFKLKYPGIDVPNKIPMPRPVDFYFKDWSGPKREEFIYNLDISSFTGNQKWLIWCLEEFLNMLDAM